MRSIDPFYQDLLILEPSIMIIKNVFWRNHKMDGMVNFSLLLERIIHFIPGMISAVVIFILTLVAAALVRKWVHRLMMKRNSLAHISDLLSKVAYWTVIVFGLITSLQQVGFNLTAFLTGVGIVGFTVGFALQDVSKNFISGILLLIQGPFENGDFIEVGDFSGHVLMVDLRTTKIKTLDGKIAFIPNADIVSKTITNYSQADSRRIELRVGVAYDSLFEDVREKALKAVNTVKGLLPDPAPAVFLDQFGDYSIEVAINYWVDMKITNPLAARDEGMEALIKLFSSSGIEMPNPSQFVLVQSTSTAGE